MTSLKEVDVSTDALLVLPASGAQVHHINGLNTGSQIYERQGNKITMHSARFTGQFLHFYASNNPLGQDNAVRMQVVMLHNSQTLGAFPYQIVNKSQNSTGGQDSWLETMQNMENKENVTILYDKIIKMPFHQILLDALGSPMTREAYYNYDFTVDLKDTVHTFNGPSDTIGDSKHGQNVYLVTSALHGVAPSNFVRHYGYGRLIFTG